VRNIAVLLPLLIATPAAAEDPAPVEPGLSGEAQIEALDAADGAVSYPDPIEPVNRVSLGFNEQLDRWLISPISRGYAWVMPDPVERAVRRVFRNAGEPISLLNHMLRFEPQLAGQTLTRFGINTIAGVAGVFDLATPAGLPESRADFGGTLHYYGTPSGPYLVVPVFGPSTLRDAAGDMVDRLLSPEFYLISGTGQIVLGTGDGISQRSEQGESLEALREQSVDFYAALRTAYYLSRESELAGDVGERSATLRSSAATNASNPSRSSTELYSARRSASSETVPPR
jgi:phospholipid-binding lipoprotein MlaA